MTPPPLTPGLGWTAGPLHTLWDFQVYPGGKLPPEVTAVDGTAAGDAFCAALVVSLLEGRERGAALERACVAGALAASRPGAQPSLPTASEVDALL